MNILFIVFQAWLILMAIGIDAFVCSFGYGVSKVKIPFKSVMVINVICSALLAAGLFFGIFMGNFISVETTEWIAFTILFLIGIFKIFDSTIKKIIRKYNGVDKEVNFSLLNLNFILKIYANPEEADVDGSKELSLKEAAPLAVALGLDNLSVGFGAGISAAALDIMIILGFSLISDIFTIMLGCYFGGKIAKKISFDLSWLSGVILVGIAFVGVLCQNK